MKLPLEGGCICGQVRYRVEAAQVVLMRERYRRWEAEVAIYHGVQAT